MIARGGTDGVYTYSVAADWADRPVNYESWASAARFCNWLANGQPTGPQDLSTTEDGSYYLNGALTNERVLAVTRKPNATWVIPNENEWYKAAFHKNNGTTGDYWDYAMGSDAAPDNGNPGGDSGNSSNFYDGDFAIGAPYYRTPVGFFSRSPSPYGTHDQGGNVQEWNETLLLGAYRGLRGGAAHHAGSSYQRATWHSGTVWNNTRPDVGFRVALVPEPASAALALASFALLTRRQRR
jgi:formylglycine-generating enzyme required for sulfatase activity